MGRGAVGDGFGMDSGLRGDQCGLLMQELEAQTSLVSPVSGGYHVAYQIDLSGGELAVNLDTVELIASLHSLMLYF
jgi:hypothetical protein